MVDASTVVAALTDRGPEGEWANAVLRAGDVSSPHVMPAEVAQTLRREITRKKLSSDVASLAHADLVILPIELFPYAPLAGRVWELRSAISAYDAWYVALAERLRAPLATLDRRLARAAGPRCSFKVPPGRG